MKAMEIHDQIPFVIATLLSFGAQVMDEVTSNYMKDNRGRTILHHAKESESRHIVNWLLEKHPGLS